MIFDQYSRYKACADLLRQVGLRQGTSVLDIGSGPECLFGQFLPDAEVSYVDPLISIGSGSKRISGDVFSAELNGQKFDCVSAVDVLEHVPAENRQAFLERLSSLSGHALILGFPTSDSSKAAAVDDALNKNYRHIFGHDYSWLEEHSNYGLPSLAETVSRLERLGWHCKTIGHGHTPWLSELLGFVICAWDVPAMHDLVLEISEQFNRDLYPNDFHPPFYRQFVVASRSPLPNLVPPVTAMDENAANQTFNELMDKAHQRFFAVTLNQLKINEGIEADRQQKIHELSKWGSGLQDSLAERDKQVIELTHKSHELSQWGSTLQTSLTERDKQINDLTHKSHELSQWGSTLQASLTERDKQINDLTHKSHELSQWGSTLQASLAERDKQFNDLSHTLHELSQWSSSLQTSLTERDKQINDLTHKSHELSRWGATLQTSLTERDKQINDLTHKSQELSQWGSTLQASLAERDKQFNDLSHTLHELSQWGSSLQASLAERDKQFNDLSHTLHELSQWGSSLQTSLTERDKQINDLTHKSQELTQWVSSLQAALSDRNQQLAETQQALDAKHTELMKMSDWAYGMMQEINRRNRPLYVRMIDKIQKTIDLNTFAATVKKTALNIARLTLHAMPISNSTKNRLSDTFYSTLRNLRRSTTPKKIKAQTAVDFSIPLVQCSPDSKKRDVFVFAVIDWHFRIQRPQHIARSLAERGHRVFYFSNHFLDTEEPGYEIEKLPGADTLFQIKLHVPGAPAIYFDPPSDDALKALKKSIAKVIQNFDALSSISILQHSYWYPLAKILPNSYRIYDCMDHHEGFGNVPAKLVEIEKEMLRSADLVTVTSSWLEDFARKHNPSVAVVRNAGEYNHFEKQPEKVYRDAMGRKIIGYYGAIAEWFDLDLVRAIALGHPDCLILLVGNDTVDAQKTLSDLANVEFTGEVPYATLPFFLHAFDVCLLPFKVIPLTLATNPVKVYEYLAAGKPVVCVDLPEVGQFANLVSRASSTADFVTMVGAALEESGVLAEEKSAERRHFASEQTWGHRGAELATALNAVRMPRISVIILTFNNLELTKACIDSVLQRSEYPNLEVIVVDNASSDDTPVYLKELTQRNPDVRIVLNAENLGFAAGNNVGLSIATGDYLVLLNNDTVVTQGWIMSLIRHFQAYPKLGLLGPVTNNIGNEARIQTNYLEINDMPSEVIQYTLARMGERYPMRNAAFFCVMFSRLTYELCGPISEDYGRGFFEDDDYCREVDSKGLGIACADDVFVHHHLSASFNKLKDAERHELFERNKAIYEKKWGSWIPHVYRE
jgi:O-antigen biosynthesis protein